MERQYYYFAASLPVVSFENEPPFSVEDYLADCKRLLVDEDHLLAQAVLTQSNNSSNTSSHTFNAWTKFVQDFKNEETWIRAEAAGVDPTDYIRGDRPNDPGYIDVLQQASKADNPLEAQKTLDRYRWKFLDDLEVGCGFSLGKILIYGLKLKILERYARIESPKGDKLFKELEEVDIPLSFAY